MKNRRSLFFLHLAEFQAVRRLTTRHSVVFVLFCFVLLVGWLVVAVVVVVVFLASYSQP